jgi:phosphonate transport system substrate-binding protein
MPPPRPWSFVTRRQILKWTVTACLSALGPGQAYAEDEPIHIGIAPVFLTEQTSLLRDWRAYLEQRLGQPVTFVQRDSYREIIDSLLSGRLEFAWICGYPYVHHRDRLGLTAIPLYQGTPLYRSYLIVPATDLATRTLTDLKGHIFAFADPDSNSGFLVPRFELVRQGLDPNHFFRKTFFSGGHRNAIEAVSVGLADGAHVDGYVWETMARVSPEITRQTRVVTRSKPFAFPPIVAGPAASEALRLGMREVLIGMGSDPAAASLLERLNLDGFTAGDPSAFDEIAAMALAAGGLARVP